MSNKNWAVAAAFVNAVSVCALSLPAHAVENGGSHAGTGAESFYAGVLPPPGFYALSYNMLYSASRLNDNAGNKAVSSFSVTQFASVNRFVYVSNLQFLGASVGSQVVLPLVNVDVNYMGMKDSKISVGDIVFTPVMLGWHSPEWHFVGAVDLFSPTGSYDRRALANTGTNYWSAAPALAVSYLPASGLEVSAKAQYYFNAANTNAVINPSSNVNGAHYRSGQEFTTDVLIAQHWGPWTAGVTGYAYYQVTSDTISDGPSNAALQSAGGYKGRGYGIGPAVRYDVGALSFALQAQHEFAVRNRPQGERFWFKASYKF